MNIYVGYLFIDLIKTYFMLGTVLVSGNSVADRLKILASLGCSGHEVGGGANSRKISK